MGLPFTRQTKGRQQLSLYAKLNIERNMNTGIKFIAVCTVYDCTAIGYITIVNLNPTTLQEKKTNVAEID